MNSSCRLNLTQSKLDILKGKAIKNIQPYVRVAKVTRAYQNLLVACTISSLETDTVLIDNRSILLTQFRLIK